MPRKSCISIELLRDLLRYDPATGELFWKGRPVEMFASPSVAQRWNARYANKPAFTSLDDKGYFHGSILGETYVAHRVIWAIVYVEWPDQVDHENHIRSDNRLSNLLSKTHAENAKNQRMPARNKSGFCGVSWDKASGKWKAQIAVSNKKHFLGHFTEKADAVAARKAGELRFGFHPNHGAPLEERERAAA